jgi:hypothetical protein
MEARQNRPGTVDPGAEDDNDLTVAELRRRAELVHERLDAMDPPPIDRPIGGGLSRPDGRDPEKFYRHVAAVYNLYAETTKAPARSMADEAEVPVTTVHRWIREARIRGFLPPGRKGRVG